MSDYLFKQLLGKIIALPKSEWAEHEKEKWITFKGVKNLIVHGSGVIEGSGPTWWKDIDSVRPTVCIFVSDYLHSFISFF